MTLGVQAISIVHMIVAGIFVGAAFETYSRFGRQRSAFLITVIQDILFWIGTGLLIFIWLREVNNGEMRVHIILSLLCGYAVYKALLQGVYRRALEAVIRGAIALYRFIVRLINMLIWIPIKWVYSIIIAFFLLIFTGLMRFAQFLYQLIRWLCRPFFHLFHKPWLWVYQSIKKIKKVKENRPFDQGSKKGFFSWLANLLYRRK